MQKGFTHILILAGIAMVALLVAGAFYLGTTVPKPEVPPAPAAITPVLTQQLEQALFPTSVSATRVISPILTQILAPNDVTASWRSYKNEQYDFQFRYPTNFIVDNVTDPSLCSFYTGSNDRKNCLIMIKFLIINTEDNFIPHAYFYLFGDIETVRFPGQISEIKFSKQRKSWILFDPSQENQVLPIWGYGKSDQEIIKGSTGGSHSSSYYYLIPDYQKDVVAVFVIPQSYRLRCDQISDTSQQTQCNNFYNSVIQKYNQGQTIIDTWLPENYIKALYVDAEIMVRSFDSTSD